LSCVLLVQVYRWFLRFVSMSGFLSIATYRSPAIGIVVSVLLAVYWYVSTNLYWSQSPDWLGSVNSVGFIAYLFTALITLAVGALVFTSMQFLGQLTTARFGSFDVGLYAAVLLSCLLIVGAILVRTTVQRGDDAVIRLSSAFLR